MGCTRNAWFPITISIQVLCDGVFVVIFFKTMYNKTIIRFGFCDILNNQSLGKCYQPRPSARLITDLPRPWLFQISQKVHPITVKCSPNRLSLVGWQVFRNYNIAIPVVSLQSLTNRAIFLYLLCYRFFKHIGWIFNIYINCDKYHGIFKGESLQPFLVRLIISLTSYHYWVL